MQAVRGATVADHAVQQATFRGADDLLLLRVEALVVTVQVKQTPAGDDIAVIPQERAPAGFAVTPGATGLLIVCFDAFGHIVVNHITHVGFVDAHTERVRGHDDRHAVGDEIPLSARPVFRRHATMVGGGNRAVRQACWSLRVAMCSGCRHEAWNRMVERGCHRFGLLASGTVHDAGFSGVRRHVLRNPCGFAFGFHPDDVEIEVWTVESSDGDQRVTQMNQRNDVATHFACCGRGERGDNRSNRKRVDELANTQV